MRIAREGGRGEGWSLIKEICFGCLVVSTAMNLELVDRKHGIHDTLKTKTIFNEA